MAYIRKTRDEWQLHINYGGGWEHEISEDTWHEIKQQAKDYRANCPQYPVKIVHKRVKIEEEYSGGYGGWTCGQPKMT